LRTPLNAIIGFAGLLRSLEPVCGQKDRQADYARIIEASGQHMLSVMETVFDPERSHIAEKPQY